MTVRGAAIWAGELEPGELAALDPGVPDVLEQRPDVLVVGGGILGVSVARACRDAGAGSVVLIEAGRLGSGATGGAAGPLIPEAHQGVDPAALVDLGRASLARWRELESTLPGGAGFIDADWFGLAPYPDGFAADPPPAAEWLDAAQVQRLLPGLTPEVAAVRVPHQGRVNPLRALSRLAAGIDQVVTGCAATAVRTRAGRLTAVSTTAGVISPGSVVFATGLPPRLEGLDLRLPSDLVKGHMAVTEPVPVVLPGLVAPLATQLEDRRLLAGGTLDTDDATAERPGSRPAQRVVHQRALPHGHPDGPGNRRGAGPLDHRRRAPRHHRALRPGREIPRTRLGPAGGRFGDLAGRLGWLCRSGFCKPESQQGARGPPLISADRLSPED